MNQKTKPQIAQWKQNLPDVNQQGRRPYIAQSKIPIVQPVIRRPVAPPVYRPQPTPRVLQTKTTEKHARLATSGNRPNFPPAVRPGTSPEIVQAKKPAAQSKRAPVAPPVYRPQPTPKVLQSKRANETGQNTRNSQQRAGSPHINRAASKGVAQTKAPIAAPRGAAQSGAPRNASFTNHRYGNPASLRGGTIQAWYWIWKASNSTWAKDDEGLADPAAATQPARAGTYDNEYVENVPVVAVVAGGGGGAAAAAVVAVVPAAAVAESKDPLWSRAYRWNGVRWTVAGEVDMVDAQKKKTKRNHHAEKAAYLLMNVNSAAWVGFVQNAWPCIAEAGNCTNYFKGESKAGPNFVFNIIGDSSGYSNNHGQGTTGQMWIVNGAVSYKKPDNLPAGSPAGPPSE